MIYLLKLLFSLKYLVTIICFVLIWNGNILRLSPSTVNLTFRATMIELKVETFEDENKFKKLLLELWMSFKSIWQNERSIFYQTVVWRSPQDFIPSSDHTGPPLEILNGGFNILESSAIWSVWFNEWHQNA